MEVKWAQVSIKRRVVITGTGAVCPLGNDTDALQTAWLNSTVAFSPVAEFVDSNTSINLAAQVTDFNAEEFLPPKSLAGMGKASRFALAAAKEAIDKSGLLESNVCKSRIGVIMGVAIGDFSAIEQGYHDLFVASHPQVNPMTIPISMINAASAQVTMMFGFTGTSYTISTACSSSTHAIGEAARLISSGGADAVVCGGTDASICWGIWKGWESLRVMDPNGCTPFDLERGGMTLGEGAGILVLEDRDSALARGVEIFGEITGYSANADASHLILPNNNSIAACMEKALSNAVVDTKDVDFISAHATGTVQNDRTETAAIKQVFGGVSLCPPISATKSMHGHLMGAAGAVETIIGLQGLNLRLVPPTMGLNTSDPACDLDYVPNKARGIRGNYFLKNSFAFGGFNACLVVGSAIRAMDWR